MSGNQPSGDADGSSAQNGDTTVMMTREAVLIRTLKSLDNVTDALTGAPMPRTSRERAIFELIALRAYAEGKGIDRNYLPALDELQLALTDAQRGKAHPMLMPEPRPIDPRHEDGRKTPGRSSRGVRELFGASEAAAAVSTLAFHGYKIEEAAKLVADELARRGISITAAKMIRARQDLDCEKHKRAARGEVERSDPTAWMVGNTTTAWMMPGESAPTRTLPSAEVIAQRHYDRCWPFAEQCYRDMAALRVHERDAAYLAIELVLDLIALRRSGRPSPKRRGFCANSSKRPSKKSATTSGSLGLARTRQPSWRRKSSTDATCRQNSRKRLPQQNPDNPHYFRGGPGAHKKRMDDDLRLLGSEGDKLDAFAALHGIVASLALALARRRAASNTSRRVVRQARSLIALATALARAFHQGHEADFEELASLTSRADALGRRGVPHDQLIAMPGDWPLRGLPINPAALALVAVMRLRHGLQDSLIAAASPRRAMQLRIVRDLELDVLFMARDLDRHAISPAAALCGLHARFAAAEPAIGPDLLELLGGAEAIIAAAMATIGTDARPAG
jgi:hypothetical protein